MKDMIDLIFDYALEISQAVCIVLVLFGVVAFLKWIPYEVLFLSVVAIVFGDRVIDFVANIKTKYFARNDDKA